MTQPIALDQHAGTGVGLDAVARGEVGGAVWANDLPVGAGQDAALKLRPVDPAADDVDHPPVAIGCVAEMTNVGELGMDVEDRLAGDQAHDAHDAPPDRTFDPRDAAP